MDFFGISNVQFGKANALFRYQRRETVATLFRLVETVLFLIAASSISTQIPATIRISGEYFRRILGTILCPQIVFVVGNLIVVVLFLKSDFLSNSDNDGTGVYEEYAMMNDKNEIFHEEQREQRSFGVKMTVNVKSIESADGCEYKIHRRIQSEKILAKRSDGEKKPADCRKVKYPEDEMSNDEFRRTVEAFIARQQRSLRE